MLEPVVSELIDILLLVDVSVKVPEFVLKSSFFPVPNVPFVEQVIVDVALIAADAVVPTYAFTDLFPNNL